MDEVKKTRIKKILLGLADFVRVVALSSAPLIVCVELIFVNIIAFAAVNVWIKQGLLGPDTYPALNFAFVWSFRLLGILAFCGSIHAFNMILTDHRTEQLRELIKRVEKIEKENADLKSEPLVSM